MKFPISKFTIQGKSMIPTLSPGQDILSFNWAYIGRKPKIGEVIVLNYQGKDMVKRVTKVEGEEIFVEGDNQDWSTDSRSFGTVSMDQIVGKVVYGTNEIPCPSCSCAVLGVYGRKDAICQNCGFKLTCCGEP